MPLSPKTRLGTYEILGPLGAGGMGEVYRARDTRLGREIAIKVLPSEVASSTDRLARFEREARTVASLNHPNIVTLFSVEEAAGSRFITMELVEGQTLSTLLTPGGLPLSRILEVAIPLTDALIAAHERGVVHRDLKPANVMMTRQGRVKVLDFGLAKMMGVDAFGEGPPATVATAPFVSGAGQTVGTPPYMSPEQLRGEEASPRSDLFSLGILLYELATGFRPFRGNSVAELTSSILRDAPEPLGRARPDLPGEFAVLVGQCLEKNPRARAQTALSVNNALRGLRKAQANEKPERQEADKMVSIAVLPFANRSSSQDDEYFSDGLADELLNVLSKIKGLRVTARTSSFHFKGKDTTIAEIGRVLDVATVLEGSVRKAGNRVRISVQLVNVANSSHVWSETYDRTLDDIFAVQDDIAQCVVKELRTTILGEDAGSDASGRAQAEVAQAVKGRGTDPEAHRLYLLSRYLLDQVNPEDTSQAIVYLNQALARDPEFALAWAGLAGAYSVREERGWVSITEASRSAREALERALELEPDLPEGHARMGWIQIRYDRDFRAAEKSLARALELAPGNAEVLNGAGVLAWTQTRFEVAIAYLRRAVEQDPLKVGAYRNLGLTLHAAGRFSESEAELRKGLELAPNASLLHSFLSVTLLAQGRGEEALREAELEPYEDFRIYSLALIHQDLGHKQESDALLLEMISRYSDVMAFQIAQVYGARGEVDPAFDWLERAYATRDPGLSEARSIPRLRSLHADSRWGPFLRRIGFEV